MEKIKILFYSHTIDYAGTWRSHERILLNLDKNLFQPYVLYRSNADNNRLDYVIKNLGSDFVIPFNSTNEKTGPDNGYSFINTDFFDVVSKLEPDIIHFARSGYYEWPFIKRLAPIQIETNIFGFRDNSEFLDYSVSISDKITELRGGCDIKIYNPIPLPINNNEDLKKELNISEGCLVFGRIGRKDNFHPISLDCLYKFKQLGFKFKYIIIGACNNTLSKINELNLNDECIVLDTTNDDDFIDKFHKSLDVFLHYRSDGETFGTAIAQSMMYGNPVISHYAGYNAQSEIISNGGYVSHNENDYLEELIKLVTDKNYYNTISNNAKIRSLDFEELSISKKFESVYITLHNNKKQ